MRIFPILLLVTVSAVDSSCPYGRAPLSSSARTFFLTSGVHNDTEELERESKQITDSPWTEEVQRICGAHIACNATQKYRSFDGSCVNLKKPSIGSRGQCYRRILAASYSDGVSAPRKSVPIADIFNALQSRPINPTPPVSAMFATIAQFIVHDMMETALTQLDENYNCCSPQKRELPGCAMRIDTTNAKPYKEHNIECMSFVRAARCPCSHERTRQSMNLQTAYLDLSHVYMSGESRLPNSPYLKTSFSKFSGNLPHLDPEPSVCYADDKRCFKGDIRMNQQQGISTHHVVFEKQHNFLAARLAKLNPSWDTEAVFQETRKILIARWQYVYCKEVLPLVIDEQLLRNAGLHIDQLMEGTQVDPNAETNILTESVHAEFRVHHLNPGSIGDHELLWLNSGKYFTERTFLSNLLKGQLYEPLNPSLPMTSRLAQEVFKQDDEPVGLSMLMINIQRGRDTGVPSFSDLVAWAFNTSIRSYDDLAKLNSLSEDDLKLLKKLYPEVQDIDMWVGGTLSLPYGTGVAPYVHQRIRLVMHHGHVFGDRFFFSHRDVFSQEQREAIAKSSSYAQILCEVMGLDIVPVEVLKLGDNITKKRCVSFDPLDLELWRDRSGSNSSDIASEPH